MKRPSTLRTLVACQRPLRGVGTARIECLCDCAQVTDFSLLSFGDDQQTLWWQLGRLPLEAERPLAARGLAQTYQSRGADRLPKYPPQEQKKLSTPRKVRL